MKLSNSLLLVATALLSANAFAPICSPHRAVFATSRIGVAAEGDVAESAMPVADTYDRIGITKDELAIGIDASEFLQWIGTKEELMGKFQRDNKGMSEETSDKEVTKFLMDSEMVNAYIKYEKDKVTNPRDLKTEAEQNLSNPKTIATYLAWLVGGASIGVIRQNIIEPKFASGEWKEIHIGAPSWFMKPAVEAADSAVQVATDAMSTAAGGM